MLSIFKSKQEETQTQTNTVQQYLDFVQLQVEQKKYVRTGGGNMGWVNPCLEIESKNKDYKFLVFFQDDKYEKSSDRIIIECDGNILGTIDLELTEAQEVQLKKTVQIYKDQLVKRDNEYQEMRKVQSRAALAQCLKKGLV